MDYSKSKELNALNNGDADGDDKYILKAAKDKDTPSGKKRKPSPKKQSNLIDHLNQRYLSPGTTTDQDLNAKSEHNQSLIDYFERMESQSEGRQASQNGKDPDQQILDAKRDKDSPTY